jgi:hypothetical protein
MSIRSMTAAIALSALGAACSSDNGASGSFTGTVQGTTVKVNDVVSATGVQIATAGSLADCNTNTDCTTAGETCIAGSCGSASGKVAAVVLTSVGGLCAKVSANQEPKNSQYFVLVVADVNLSTGDVSAPAAVGNYAVVAPTVKIPPPHFAKVLFQTTDASCHTDSAHSEPGATGTIQLTRVDANGFAGTYDITLQQFDSSGNPVGTADHVTGNFNSVNCNGLAGLISTSRQTTCI